MSGITEIYICKPGQAIKDGQVEASNIQTKHEARTDAERRFKHDKSIGKIAYYDVRRGTGTNAPKARKVSVRSGRKTDSGIFGKICSMFKE